MADQERKGDDFVAQADKKLKGWAFFGGKYDDAAELLEKAGTAYKVAKACTYPWEPERSSDEGQGLVLGSFHFTLFFSTSRWRGMRFPEGSRESCFQSSAQASVLDPSDPACFHVSATASLLNHPPYPQGLRTATDEICSVRGISAGDKAGETYWRLSEMQAKGSIWSASCNPPSACGVTLQRQLPLLQLSLQPPLPPQLPPPGYRVLCCV